MNNMLNSINYKNEQINWIVRIILYFCTYVLAVIAIELVLLLVTGLGTSESLLASITSFIAMSVASFVIVLIFEKSKLSTRFGFERDKVMTKYLIGYGLGILLIVASGLPIMIFFADSISLTNPLPLMPIFLYFLFFLIQGASEEIFVRGFIFPIIVKHSTPFMAVVTTSGFFAALHLLNPGITLISVVNLFLAGALFGYCVLYFDSLWQACALHSAWNFVQGNILGFKVSGMNVEPLLTLNLSGNDLFTGGQFGVEGSIFSTIILMIIITILHKGCVKKGIVIFSKTQLIK